MAFEDTKSKITKIQELLKTIGISSDTLAKIKETTRQKLEIWKNTYQQIEARRVHTFQNEGYVELKINDAFDDIRKSGSAGVAAAEKLLQQINDAYKQAQTINEDVQDDEAPADVKRKASELLDSISKTREELQTEVAMFEKIANADEKELLSLSSSIWWKIFRTKILINLAIGLVVGGLYAAFMYWANSYYDEDTGGGMTGS